MLNGYKIIFPALLYNYASDVDWIRTCNAPRKINIAIKSTLKLSTTLYEL